MKNIMLKSFEIRNKNLVKYEFIRDTSFMLTISICDL